MDGSEISGAIDSAQAGFDSLVDGAQKGFNTLVDGVQGVLPGAGAEVAPAVEDASEAYDAPETEEAAPAAIGGYDGGSFGAAL